MQIKTEDELLYCLYPCSLLFRLISIEPEIHDWVIFQQEARLSGYLESNDQDNCL